jgi:hypothetical protein
MALVLSHMRGTWEHSSPKSLSVYVIQSSCEQQLAAPTYSAYVVDWATLDCLREDQETSEEPKNWQVPLQEIVWSMTKFPWHFLISSQITLHPWWIVRFRHRFVALDMKPDMKSKHYDIVSISSQISSQITQHPWQQSDFIID